jgi:hypothetical protein
MESNPAYTLPPQLAKLGDDAKKAPDADHGGQFESLS